MAGHGSLAELLARRLRASGQPVEEAITVAELHKVLLPYHRCRDALGYATKAEYDLALLHLLDDPERVRIHEEELAEAVEEELASPEPGLGFLRNFAAAQVRLRTPDGDAAGAVGSDARERDWLEAYEPPAAGTAPPGSAAGTPAAGAEGSPEGAEAPAEEPGAGRGEADGPEGRWAPGERCWGCESDLPERPSLRFCPFCGADQTVRRCSRCEEALEPGWSFCPRCGAETGGA